MSLGCILSLASMHHTVYQNIIIIYFFSRPVHGLIFLFKWVPDPEPDGSVVQDSRLEKIFFAKQVRGTVEVSC